MARKKRRLPRRVLKPSEEWRVELLGGELGLHHRTIASVVFAKGKVPENRDVAIVSKILRRAEISTRDYRNGLTPFSKAAIRERMKRPEES
jgi:hypothetical protein